MVEGEDLLGLGNAREKKSLFHGGFAYLERIDGILRALDEIAISNGTCSTLSIRQYIAWHGLLKSLFKELYPKMGKQEREEHLAMMEEVTKGVSILEEASRRKQTRVPKTIIDSFYFWELSLRDVVGKKGLLMPSKRDGLDATED
ncbi:hypothetical protein ACFLZ6_00110 [Nanoarchaeota archaeon]